MDLLLINPDHDNKKNNFPWGVLSVGSYLSNIKNYEIKILDASIYSKSEFFQKLKYFCNGTKLIGISCMSTDVYSVKEMIDYIKEMNKSCKIIVGGPHAVLQPEQTCLYKNIDFVAYTEGEHTLSMLIDEIKSGDQRYDKIPGLIYKDRDSIRRTPPSELIGFYDINYELLAESVQKTFPEYMQVLVGRGCSFKCTFCFNSICGQKWRGRPMPEVINELEKIVEKYDPQVIYFRDENFFHSKNRIKEFISSYKEKGFNFKWQALCRASYYNKRYIDLDFLRELESINCEQLRFGFESGSQRVLNYLKKGINVDNVKRLVYDLSKVTKINGNYSFMIGVPDETYEEYKKTLALIKYIIRHQPDAQILGPQYFRVYPGGELYEEIKRRYNYYEPQFFEEWANATSNKVDFRSSLDIDYPWVPKRHRLLAQNADLMVSIYRIDIRKYFKISRIVHLVFILFVKLRFKLGMYKYLYDLIAVISFRKLKYRFVRS